MVSDKNSVGFQTILRTKCHFIWVWKLLLLELRLGRFHYEGLGGPQPILTAQDGNTSNILTSNNNMNTRKAFISWPELYSAGSERQLSRYQRRKSSSFSPSPPPMTLIQECPNLVLLALCVCARVPIPMPLHELSKIIDTLIYFSISFKKWNLFRFKRLISCKGLFVVMTDN